MRCDRFERKAGCGLERRQCKGRWSDGIWIWSRQQSCGQCLDFQLSTCLGWRLSQRSWTATSQPGLKRAFIHSWRKTNLLSNGYRPTLMIKLHDRIKQQQDEHSGQGQSIANRDSWGREKSERHHGQSSKTAIGNPAMRDKKQRTAHEWNWQTEHVCVLHSAPFQAGVHPWRWAPSCRIQVPDLAMNIVQYFVHDMR